MKHNYKIIDAHCDTIGEIYRHVPLVKNEGHLDIERMEQYKNYMQIFAVWADAGQGEMHQKSEHDRIIAHFYDEMASNSDAIMHVTSATDAKNAWNSGKIAALLSIEGADCVKSLDDIENLYRRGVRCITLTWNGTNHLAGGVGDDTATFGLTDLGREAVKLMNKLGMLVDVSHISPHSFRDVIETSSAPIAATHSNAKAVCAHRRNLTDEQFTALCKNGGVAGINYYPPFVNNTDNACIDDIIKHIEHFCSLGGENHIGLGGDFDGIDTTPSDLCGVQDVYILLDRLLELNYSEKLVQKIAYRNFMRLFETVIR